MLVKNRIILQKNVHYLLTKKENCDMFISLKGWFPGNSHAIRRGERLLYGDHREPGLIPRVRGLTNLALCGRLFLFSRWEALEGVKK